MDRYFGCKLDFLMKVIGVKNSVLARALNFDPSYISRVRAGKRGISGRQDFIDGAASFFARNVSNDLQRAAISNAIGEKAVLSGFSEMAEHIAGWLGDGLPFDLDMRRDTAHLFDASPGGTKASDPSYCCNLGGEGVAFFYGDEGKRQAVEAFLSDLLMEGKPVSLLLYSDESMLWLTEDEAFAKRWADLLFRLMNLGSTIKIVHTVSRDIGDMLEGMRKWIPLYATGRIEPFYCPKIRDGIFKRTLFVAQGVSAVSASSCGKLHSPACLYVKDRRAAEAFSREFAGFLTLCESLGKTYELREIPYLMEDEAWLSKRPGRILLAGGAPLLSTLPQATVKKLAAQSGDSRIEQLWQRACTWTDNVLEAGTCIIDIVDASFSAAHKDSSPLAFVAGALDAPEASGESGELETRGALGEQRERALCYSAEDRSAHLSSAQQLARECDNYHLLFCRDLPRDVSFVVAENSRAIVSFAAPWCISMVLEERRMVQALGEYLERMASA